MFKTIIPNAIYNGVDISEIIIRLKTLSYNSIITSLHVVRMLRFLHHEYQGTHNSSKANFDWQ